jgi:predicted MPP superfamily phosphohydrolase
MVGYTNRGLGVGDVPLRFNCRGDIVVITMRRSVQRT